MAHIDNEKHTVGSYLQSFWKENNIPQSCESDASWTTKVGFIMLRFPNFNWRRKAIVIHDLHHIITGYPCNMRGECQVATWEFAAGKYPHICANLFCLPLVSLGFFWSPSRIWRAYIYGRNSKSLYHIELTPMLLDMPISELRTHIKVRDSNTSRVIIGFFTLMLGSSLMNAFLVMMVFLALFGWA